MFGDECPTCSNCDLQQLEQLSKILFDKYYSAMHNKYPTLKEFKLPKAIKLKRLLIEAAISPPLPRMLAVATLGSKLDAFIKSLNTSVLTSSTPLPPFNENDPY